MTLKGATMSDQEKKQQSMNISSQPDAEKKKRSEELSEEELKKVSGGAPSISEIVVTKQTDVAS
jgi:bacteriocin-like protein